MGHLVEDRSSKFKSVIEDWKTVTDIWGGETKIKAAGQKYLVKEPLESDESYTARLQRSTFTNFYRTLITNNVATIFVRPIQIEANSEISNTKVFDEFNDNADTEGRTITQVSHTVENKAYNYGVSYVLVDYPVVDDPGTKLDERLNNRRPYLTEIEPMSVLDARTVRVTNEDVLVHFRYEETHTTWDSLTFKENTNKRIRSYNLDLTVEPALVTFSIWEKPVNEEWKLLSGPTVITGQTRIPIVPVYTNRIMPYLGSPPKLDLARLNIRHYQSQSDQINSLHYARIPILLTKGFNELDDKGEPKKLKWSINTTIDVGTDGDVKWVEHTGKALESGEKDLERTVEQMEMLGLNMRLNNRPGGITATAEAIDKAESDSPILAAANDLESALMKMYEFAGNYVGELWKPKIEIPKEHAVIDRGVGDMESVFKSHAAGVVSDAQLLRELQRRGVVAATYEPELSDDLKPVITTPPIVDGEEGGGQEFPPEEE